MTFREITDPGDSLLLEVEELYSETIANGHELPSLLEQVRLHRNKNTVWHLLAIEGDEGLYGFAHVTYLFAGFAFLNHLAVRTAFRRHGLGGALMQGALESCEIDSRVYNRPFYGMALESPETLTTFFLARGAGVLSTRYKRPSPLLNADPIPASLLWLEVESGLTNKVLIPAIYKELYGLGGMHRLVVEALAGAAS